MRRNMDSHASMWERPPRTSAALERRRTRCVRLAARGRFCGEVPSADVGEPCDSLPCFDGDSRRSPSRAPIPNVLRKTCFVVHATVNCGPRSRADYDDPRGCPLRADMRSATSSAALRLGPLAATSSGDIAGNLPVRTRMTSQPTSNASFLAASTSATGPVCQSRPSYSIAM